MALSSYERMIFDESLKTLASQLSASKETKNFLPLNLVITLSEIAHKEFHTYNPSTTIDAAIKRTRLPFIRYNGYYTFQGDKIYLSDSINFRKEKDKLFFDCYEGLYYDFTKKNFSIENFTEKVFNKSHFILNKYFLSMLQYEWLFNYTTDIRCIIRIHDYAPQEAYQKMPAGLYNEVIVHNNGKIDYDTLSEYYFTNFFGKKYYQFAKTICSYNQNAYEYLINFLKKYNFELLLKLIKNSLLNGEFIEGGNVFDFLRVYSVVTKETNFQLDDNRDLEYNYDMMKNLLEAEKNKILAKQLQKLNFINHLVYEDLIVVVPQSQEEKQEEGRMQHNCVGYYYDNSILDGNNLIYFIRKINTPDHSYVTCRFSKIYHETVEYKTVNNNTVHDQKVISFINKLDDIIRQHNLD